MHIVVFLAGMADTKWPFRGIDLDAGGMIRGEDVFPRAFTPFDESALETALKIRDEDPGVSISALLLGAAQSDVLLKAVAALRVHAVSAIEHQSVIRWDPAGLSVVLRNAIAAMPTPPDLVLLGREFGDCDDGALAPTLAETLGWRFVGLVQQASVVDGRIRLRRMRGNADECILLPAPVVASVSNDKSNRLRRPLLKNVMAARSVQIGVMPANGPETGPRVVAAELDLQEAGRRNSKGCQMLDGPVENQVSRIVRYLEQWKSQA